MTALDAIAILQYGLGTAAPRCADAADADDDGSVGIDDAVYLLRALFRRGPLPPAPFARPGLDPTEDGIDCAG